MGNAPFRKPTEAEFKVATKAASDGIARRLPAQVGRVRALDTLHSQLVANERLYRGGLQDQRDAVASSLIAVQKYLAEQGFNFRLLETIMRPVEALVEREKNALDQMFTERVRVGRPGASLRDHQRAGILAAFAESWLAVHQKEDGTQKRKLAGALRILKGPWFGSLNIAELKAARDLVMQETKDHAAVQTFVLYYGFLVQTAERFGDDNAIPIMVRCLNDASPGFGFGTSVIWETPHVLGTE